MPSFSVGFAQIEDRLHTVRRRLNLLTLQDALYLSGSLVALAAALLIALAVRGGASFFAVAVWMATATITATIAAAAVWIRRRWLSLDQVVRYADRQAALEDRLTTLLLDPRRLRTSRLNGLLLEQTLAAAPRWDVDTLVPRRVPRSVLVFAAALTALIVTSYFSRPPATPKSTATLHPHVNGMDAEASVLQPRPENGRATVANPPEAVEGLQVAGVTGSGAATARPSSVSRGESRAQNAPQSGTAANNPLADQLGPHDAGAVPQSEAALPGMAKQLQDAIRKALGATDSTGDTPGTTANSRSDPDREADPPPSHAAGPRRDGTDATHPSANSATSQPPSASSKLPGTGSAATAGARGGAAGELFGNQSEARGGTGQPQNLPVALGAFSTIAPSRVEPQHQAPPVGDAAGASATHAPPPLPDEQIPDAPLQKAEVAPEHETLIRRIFTRDE